MNFGPLLSSVGRKFPIEGVAQFTYPPSSWRNVLRLTHINNVDVGHRITSVVECCACILLHTSQSSSEQFSETGLKKLINKTQDAVKTRWEK